MRAALLALAVVFAGACDTTSGDGDEDPFVGTWSVTRVEINGQDFTDVLFGLAEIQDLDATFESNGEFEMAVVRADGRTETTGVYSLAEDEDVIELRSDEFEQPISLEFEMSGSDVIELMSDDVALLSELSGIDPAALGLEIDEIAVTLRRQ